MKKAKMSLLSVLLMIGLIPLLVSALVISAVSVSKISSSMEKETYEKLKVAAVGLEQYYAWDIINLGSAAYEHDYVDSLLSQGIELTLFLGDTRYITSIKGADGKRNEGTQAAADIYATVKSGKEYFANKVPIGNGTYYVYYVPVRDNDGTVVGMAFAGISDANITSQITGSAMNSVVIAVILAIVFATVVAAVSNIIKKSIVSTVAGIETMADGNLNVNCDMKSDIKEIVNLIEAAKKLQSNTTSIISTVLEQVALLDKNMTKITEDVEVCNEASSGITRAVEEMTNGSGDIAESVQNTSANMQDIGEGISEIHELASATSEATKAVAKESNLAKEELLNLMQANKNTVKISDDVMSGISESAVAVENIRKAADMIAGIASQTSLLALNASIEAARAGEAGRGFAVVAGEISNLASQSDVSTKGIQVVVDEIMKSSQHNVELANKIKNAVDDEGDVLNRVSGSFDVVNKSIQESANAVNNIMEKSTSLDDAKKAVIDEISSLSAISEENAASCQETNAGMEELAANVESIRIQSQNTQEIATKLRDVVSYFSI